jgi:hypothetical protein
LEVKDGKEAGLDELRFGDRSRDAEQRLTRKEDRAFRKRPNVTPEAELREIAEEVGMDMSKYGQSTDVRNFLGRKVNVFEEVETLFEARSDEIVAVARELTHEKFESSAGFKVILDVARGHRKFIKVRKEPGEVSARKHDKYSLSYFRLKAAMADLLRGFSFFADVKWMGGEALW